MEGDYDDSAIDENRFKILRTVYFNFCLGNQKITI